MKYSCTIVLAFLMLGLVQSYPQFNFNNLDQFFDLATSSAATPTQAQTTTASSANSPQYFACLQSCPATSEYNPICGTDNVSYFNGAKFDCAVRCGNNVQRRNLGACPSLLSG